MLPRSMTKSVLPLLVIVGVFALVATAARSPVATQPPEIPSSVVTEADTVVSKLDQLMAEKWRDAKVEPARAADEFTILRRLSLVLHGTIPSLEEIRLFEADTEPQRIERWTERMLADRRFSDYFARRLARVFVGADDGQFILFRRDRFWAWLGQQLHDNRPYDEVVRDMLAERGLWTGEPEVNFITASVAEGNIDHNKLAGRTVRAFLGQRIDCAQCHNHPFADWKQSQFEGLAASFGQLNISPVGVEDNRKEEYSVEDTMTLKQRKISPAVPFHPEWLPSEGTQRQKLAAWVTHPDNRRFERAIVNRVWGLMFGRPWIEPVDDLPPATVITKVTPKGTTLHIRGTATDNVGVKQVTIRLRTGGQVASTAAKLDGMNWEAVLREVPEGAITVEAVSEDLAGNVEKTPAVVK